MVLNQHVLDHPGEDEHTHTHTNAHTHAHSQCYNCTCRRKHTHSLTSSHADANTHTHTHTHFPSQEKCIHPIMMKYVHNYHLPMYMSATKPTNGMEVRKGTANKIDGWGDKWMDGWMAGWMDEWIVSGRID